LSMTSAAGFARRSQAHATQKLRGKTKPKALRSGAAPAEPLGDRLPLFRRAQLSTLWFSFSELCCSLAVALAALQAFSIPPHCLFGRWRIA